MAEGPPSLDGFYLLLILDYSILRHNLTVRQMGKAKHLHLDLYTLGLYYLHIEKLTPPTCLGSGTGREHQSAL